jgi:hypothetical protein
MTHARGATGVRRNPPEAGHAWRAPWLVLWVAVAACSDAGVPEQEPRPPEAEPPTQEVVTYRACPSETPGGLLPMSRSVPIDQDPVAGAVAELLKGVDESEASRGCTSFFSSATEGALRTLHRNDQGDTLFVDFRDFSEALPGTPAVRSFLPPGVMAELTWTLFHFESIHAVRFSFEGDESAFWRWLGGPGARVEVFTRTDWEQI